jgi:hypothetical protein
MIQRVVDGLEITHNAFHAEQRLSGTTVKADAASVGMHTDDQINTKGFTNERPKASE